MTNPQWKAFSSFRDAFRTQCGIWSADALWLAGLQKEAADADRNPSYPLQTPIVYNRALDSVSADDEIRMIIVGDNPGKDEQLEENRRYLVGQAGKLGDGFFRRNPELGIDFRRNVIILNKTPIHTAKTKQLAYILRQGGSRFATLFADSQRWMARETAALRDSLGCGLWLVGYGELRRNGLFSVYADELTACVRSSGTSGTETGSGRLYQHFSMNRFSIDLSDRKDSSLSLDENLKAIGIAHRRDILGW